MKEGTIYIVIVFPRPWPPSTQVTLLEKEQGFSLIRLYAFPDGHLAFLVEESKRQLIFQHFQPIKIHGAGRAILTLVWDENSASLWLNAENIQSFQESNGKPHILKEKNTAIESTHPISVPNPENISNELEQLFIGTIKDIYEKLSMGSKYSLIRASGLLRHLLLDADPLINQINKKYKLKIEFETIDFTTKPPLDIAIHWRSLDRSLFPNAKKRKVKLNKFLAINCLTLDNTEYAVKDIIKACAHIKGGIHSGKPEIVKEKGILDFDKALKIFGLDSSLAAMKGIIRVVIAGLQPLVNAIEIQSRKNG